MADGYKPGSAAEEEIRVAVEAHLRVMLPQARIVHELVTKHVCRADLAAIEPERITLVEIKSKRDKLTRLEKQVETFHTVGHDVLLVADRKWFRPGTGGLVGAIFWPDESKIYNKLATQPWPWPAPSDDDDPVMARYNSWRIMRWKSRDRVLSSMDLLELLWAEELRVLCRELGHTVTNKATREHTKRLLAWECSGRDVTRGVCRALRCRSFARADEPIKEQEE